MAPGQHQATTSGDVPSSLSSSSLSSSFSSSAASSMLMHGAPPSDSSQSDIASPDISASPPTPSKKRFFTAPSVFSPQPRSSSLAAMGQAFSKGQQSPSPGPTQRSGSPGAPPSAGQRLKRAFAGRRKKSDEASTASSDGQRPSAKGKERAADLSPPQITPSSSNDSRLQYRTQPLRLPNGAKQMTLQLATSTLQVFSNRRGVLSNRSSALPPPPPPKPPGMTTPRSPPPVQPTNPPAPAPAAKPTLSLPVNTARSKQENRGSVMATSPSIAPALDFLRASEGEPVEERRPRERKDPEKDSEKEIWRKSDSTMASHSTIRPGAGSRSPRPLSIAESLQSTSTVVAVNKRLSSIITDADYATPEEDIPDDSEPAIAAAEPPLRQTSTPPPSSKTRNRRSVSLTLGSPFQLRSKAAGEPMRTPEFEIEAPAFSSRSFSDPRPLAPHRSYQDNSSLDTTAATGFISPMRGGGSPTPANGNMQGRLAAWNASSSPSSGHHLAPPRDQYSDRQRVPSEGQSLRQTAISVTSGFAPAAFGFGKRAVEKMGRAWGGLTSSSSSGHSSSSSSIAPSSFSGGHPLGRVHSNQSTSSQSNASGSFPSKHKQRRTPNAPSATWSISSSATGSSLSEGEQFPAASVGPSLGKRMRGPLRLLNSSSAAATGLVFGRDLKSCVQETAINPARFRRDDDESVHNGGHRRQRSRGLDMELVGAKALEDRMLPALVVRCAQHLLRWGIEEEGLFRISGRSSHINKLRAEFDTGADYDISDCSPGDLDPHAVASIFKAYLRELPEPILTHALTPYFDAAMMAENNARSAEEPSEPRMQRASRGPTLPAGPRSGHPGLRKPPSLSTLAMPNFSGIRPPSQPLLNALSSLISRLPPENRDLLRTVTELIKETAKRHKDTKMPLSNLLLVFCPSLSMSPSLLRVLCEAEGIWDGPLKNADDPYIIDIKADPSPVIDIRSEDDDAADSDGEDGQDGESSAAQEMPSDRDSLPGEDDEGESESDDDEVVQFPTVVERKIMRPSPASPGQSSVVRTPSPLAASSPAPSRGDSIYAPGVSPSDSSSYKDDAASYVSASDVPSSDASERMFNPYSPRALTSSADSLATPSTMSDDPSLPQVPGAAPEKPLPSFEAFSSPKIADNSNLPLPPTETSNPVPFPSEAEMTKRDPIAERSRPLAVSMVNQMLEYDEHSRSPTGTSPSPRMTRVKKPSLHLLFTKRKSGSSPSPVSSPLRRSGVQAISPYLHTAATSTSSVSTPITAVTAPQASTFSLPPKLDLSIESSPLDLNIPVAGGAKASSLDQASDLASPGESSESTGTITQSIFPLQERTMSSISSSTYESSRSHETPIADMYCSGSSSPAPSVQAPSALGKSGSASQSQVSLTPSSYDKLHVGVHDSNDEPEEDWAGSVLKAAQSGLSDREGTAAGASR